MAQADGRAVLSYFTLRDGASALVLSACFYRYLDFCFDLEIRPGPRVEPRIGTRIA